MSPLNQEKREAQTTKDETKDVSTPARGWFNPAGRMASFLARIGPRTLAYVILAVVIGQLAQAAAIMAFFFRSEIPGQAHQELGLASISSSQAPLLTIRFSAQATSSDISHFLINYKAEVVGGPRAGNFYDVRIAGVPSKSEIAPIIKQMQQRPEIVDLVAVKD